MPYTLSTEQVSQYHQEGYLILRASEHKLVDPIKLQQWTAEVKGWPKAKGKWMPYEEVNSQGETQLLRTEKFVDYHPEFYDFLCGEDMATLLQQLSGDEMHLFKDKINYKLAHGNGFNAHLDAPAYDHINPNPNHTIQHITANLAVDTAHQLNGCLEVVPKSHKLHTSPTPIPYLTGGHITPEWENSQTWLPVPLEPGDMLIFGSYLAHRSGPNNTERPRSMVYATYAGESDGGRRLREAYYDDRRERFPPEHERVEGKDYSAGWERYAFAAPFSRKGMGERQPEQGVKAVEVQ